LLTSEGAMENTRQTPRVAVQARIKAAMSSLRPAEAQVARLVLDQPEIAVAAEASTATVVRFAQQLGFKGFHALKLALAQELAVFEQAQTAQQPNVDPRIAALVQVTQAGAETVRDAAALVDPDAFEAVVDAIAAAGRVVFVGVGTSAPLCQDAAYRFSAIGVAAQAPSDVHVQHLQARLLSAEDVCVVVSHTGSTRETLQIAQAAHDAGATTVAITSFARSALTELVDHVILAGTRELSFRLEAMASRLAHLALLDALLVAVAARDESRTQAALQSYTDVLGDHRL
jgi:RpiR family carbohydrate utilization transcriptional regulator